MSSFHFEHIGIGLLEPTGKPYAIGKAHYWLSHVQSIYFLFIGERTLDNVNKAVKVEAVVKCVQFLSRLLGVDPCLQKTPPA